MQRAATSDMLRRVKRFILYNFLRIRRNHRILLRLGLVVLFSSLAFLADESRNYDFRFFLRGDQPVRSDIVLITLRSNDFSKAPPMMGIDDDTTAFTSVNDSIYWNREKMQRILDVLLARKVKGVGVALYFPDEYQVNNLTDLERNLFFDERVAWESGATDSDVILPPLLANPDRINYGYLEFKPDDDGTVRKAGSAKQGDHFIEVLTGTSFPGDGQKFINFRGYSAPYASFTMTDLFSGQIPPEYFDGKWILIGADSPRTLKLNTPSGALTKLEITAHLLDTHLSNMWPKRTPYLIGVLLILAAVVFTTRLVTKYPSNVAFFFSFWISLFLAALSAWMFDVFAVWIPVVTPLSTILATWVIVVGYQASIIERKNFILEREKYFLNEVDQLKTNFVSLFSHDLKTPIAKIQAVINRIIQDNPDTRFNKDLADLRNFSDQLLRSIQGILKISRVESKDFRLNLESIDVNELVEHVCEDLRPLLEAKRLKLHKKLEPLFSIDCDTALIQEVILNLIDNAIKYTPEGGEIHIATYEKADFVFFLVKDTGEGITARDQERLFNKFARGHNQDLRTQGTGLGLYLVKYFIELHKGKVLLESSPQRGTRVTVSIPTVIQISENDLILKRDPTLKKEEGDNHEQNIANA